MNSKTSAGLILIGVVVVAAIAWPRGSNDPAITGADTFIHKQQIDTSKDGWREQLPEPPQLEFAPGARYLWHLDTNQGPMTIELWPQMALKHVSSTIYLTRLGFYDGLAFHRVIPKFMAQGGDPRGDGSGGPGYGYDGEFYRPVKMDRAGLLAMANTGQPKSDGSQFFLTFGPTHVATGQAHGVRGRGRRDGHAEEDRGARLTIGQDERAGGHRARDDRGREGQVVSEVPLPKGFAAAGTWCGIKREGRGLDLGVLVAEAAFPAAAMFTTNALLGSHIPVCREHLERSGGLARAIVVNSGNANCATGEKGVDDARRTARAVGERLGCPAEQVLPISTGAIGAHLPMDRILGALPALLDRASPDLASEFARAVMTTDTHAKLESERAAAGARVTGVAKGAGMIHPNMATMLGFLTTDAELAAPAELLRRVVDRTFHRITIDGDTSPNDTVVLWGSGRAGAADVERELIEVGARLGRQIAADGEGATRLVTVRVSGAASDADAALVGRVIATSPLVKTAIAGRDPNWGRILSAAGRAGVPIDVQNARVFIGRETLYEDGRPFPEREHEAWRHLNEEREVTIGVDLGVGDGTAEVWTCDLTADYVRINADYRT